MTVLILSIEYINIPINWYKHYSTAKNGLNEEVDRLLKQLIFRERCRKVEQRSANGEEQIEIINRLWQIIVLKHS